MKILHVAPVFFPEGPGGIQVHVRDVARAQLAAGHAVTILAGSLEGRPEPLVEEQETLGLRVLRLYRDDLHHVHHARGYHAEASRLIAQAFAVERPDLVHVHSWIALSTDLVALAEGFGLPTVVTLHDFLVSCPRAYRQDSAGAACLRPMGLEACGPCAPRFGFEDEALVAESIELFGQGLRSELERARALVTLLPGIGQSLLELGGLGDLELEAIPLGYVPHPSVPRAPARSGGPVRFATWGRLGTHKGTDLAVRAFVQACEALPAGAVELHLFGELLPDSYRRSVLEAAAGAKVIEHGAFEFADLAAAGVDVALFPSRCLETFGFVIDEARELGLPLVLTDLGAYGERAAGDSLVVADGDQAGWARAIERLAADAELRARLAAAAPAPSPTPEVYAQRLTEVYERALATPPRVPRTEAPDPRALDRAARTVRRGSESGELRHQTARITAGAGFTRRRRGRRGARRTPGSAAADPAADRDRRSARGRDPPRDTARTPPDAAALSARGTSSRSDSRPFAGPSSHASRAAAS